MTPQLGQGKYRYDQVMGWGQGPQGRTVGIASGVAVDSRDLVYVVDREPRPAILVYNRDGQFLRSWGEDLFVLPHDIWISPDDRLFIADCGDHTVRICTPEGKVLLTLGTPPPHPQMAGQPGRPGEPFNMPTRAIQTPAGDIFVSDGYKQEFVHRFSADGELLQTWGGRGRGPGQFSLPHNVFSAPDGRILVADREPNNRIQVFDPHGKFLTLWPGRLFPCGLFISPDGIVYIAEGAGVSIFNLEGQMLSRFDVRGDPAEVEHGAHGIWVDRHGDIYVGEVGAPNLLKKFKRLPAAS